MSRVSAGHFDEGILTFGRELASCRLDLLLADKEFGRDHALLTARLRAVPMSSEQESNLARVRGMWVAVPADDVSHKSRHVISIGGKGANDEELAEVLIHLYNGRCCWVLVQAYEAFERFVKKLYADAGYANYSIWRCQEFGSIGADEIASLAREWFQKQVKAQRDLDGILSRLRAKVEGLHDMEKENTRGIQFAHWQRAIEMFRHQIVHASGTVPNDFEDKVKKAIGSPNWDSLGGRTFGRWFRPDGDRRILWLVNDAELSRDSYAFVNSPIKRLMDYLTSHACLLYRKTVEQCGCVPFWERPPIERTSTAS